MAKQLGGIMAKIHICSVRDLRFDPMSGSQTLSGRDEMQALSQSDETLKQVNDIRG